ncbi:MAG: alkaline phosphatase [Streptosporangiales bacterium]|nr:alkaline phosphatase [Streptosporangiales bacterium]
MRTRRSVLSTPDRLEGIVATRRRFLTFTGAAAAAALTPDLLGIARDHAAPRPGSKLRGNPFGLGIASGDPLSNAVVIWTRLAPEPLAPFGGMEYEAVPVLWQVAEDERFGTIVKSGTAQARPESTHAVHVDVRGLRPGRDYFYRFNAGGEISPVGRTRTAPADGAPLDRLAFAFASCQSWTAGHYTAYADMARQDLDVILHLGDYIYEYGVRPDVARDVAVPSRLAFPSMVETETLDQYRDQYALFKSDPDLQAAHAIAPWIVTIDDHEVVDNWAGRIDKDETPWARFLLRRANALRAHWEHMPLRLSQLPTGPDMRIYRRFTFGDLAQFNVLDTRQHRSDQVEQDSSAWQDPARTMTGKKQEDWLLTGLAGSAQRWKVVAQQNALSRLDSLEGAGTRYSMDMWDGYPASRRRILAGAHERHVRNLVSLGGDVHRSIASDLKLDFGDQKSPNVGVEFTGTSISSGGDGVDLDASGRRTLDENPHVRFVNVQRGYVHCTVTPSEWQSEFRVANQVTDPGGTVSTRTRLVVEDGSSRIQSTSGAQP